MPHYVDISPDTNIAEDAFIGTSIKKFFNFTDLKVNIPHIDLLNFSTMTGNNYQYSIFSSSENSKDFQIYFKKNKGLSEEEIKLSLNEIDKTRSQL